MALGPSLSGSSLSTPQHPPWKRETLDLAAWKSERPDTFITSPNCSGLGLSQTCPLEYNFPSPHRSTFFGNFFPTPVPDGLSRVSWGREHFLGATPTIQEPGMEAGNCLPYLLRSSLPPRGNSPLVPVLLCDLAHHSPSLGLSPLSDKRETGGGGRTRIGGSGVWEVPLFPQGVHGRSLPSSQAREATRWSVELGHTWQGGSALRG